VCLCQRQSNTNKQGNNAVTSGPYPSCALAAAQLAPHGLRVQVGVPLLLCVRRLGFWNDVVADAEQAEADDDLRATATTEAQRKKERQNATQNVRCVRHGVPDALPADSTASGVTHGVAATTALHGNAPDYFSRLSCRRLACLPRRTPAAGRTLSRTRSPR